VKMSLQREVILNGNFKPKSELWFSRQKQKADEQWFEQFNKLKVYKKKYGDCMVPNSYTEDFSLRDWVKNQRFQYRALKGGEISRLNDQRIRMMEEIGFVFEVPAARTGPRPKYSEHVARPPKPIPEYIDIVRSKATRWNEKYEQLQKFKEKHGHCIVPTKYKTNPQLGCWVSTQRVHYKRMQVGRLNSLSQEKIDRLNALDFVWDATEHAAKLTICPDSDANVGESSEENVKEKMKGSKSKPSARAGKRLNEVAWMAMYDKLVAYKDAFGTCLVPCKFEDSSLVNWVGVQRRNYKARQRKEDTVAAKRMSPERIELLEKVGFVWNARSDTTNTVLDSKKAKNSGKKRKAVQAEKSPRPVRALRRNKRRSCVSDTDTYGVSEDQETENKLPEATTFLVKKCKDSNDDEKEDSATKCGKREDGDLKMKTGSTDSTQNGVKEGTV